jgi:hypothetical protein
LRLNTVIFNNYRCHNSYFCLTAQKYIFFRVNQYVKELFPTV